jgi:hypothetical protein
MTQQWQIIAKREIFADDAIINKIAAAQQAKTVSWPPAPKTRYKN